MQQSGFGITAQKSFVGNQPVEQGDWAAKSSIKKTYSSHRLTLRRVQSDNWLCWGNGLPKTSYNKRRS